MTTLIQTLTKLSISEVTRPSLSSCYGSVRFITKFVDLPVIGHGKSFRRIVHYPKEYTVKPLDVTNLAGRDPATGRVVVQGIGGGIKHKYHWIDWHRVGPKDDSPPQLERVIKIIEDGCRTAHVALVAVGDKLKYIIATENMKAGDILKTSCFIPRNPVRANEGDAYPLGALPLGTKVCCIEKLPGLGGFIATAAGTCATILRKASDNRVIIVTPSKKEFNLLNTCMCTVGRVSNVEYGSTPIGSAQRMRELGNRPRSGLWQRKTGRFGRKLRNPPPVNVFSERKPTNLEVIQLTMTERFTK